MAGPLREDFSLQESSERLDGAVPVLYRRGMEERASEVRRLVEIGATALSEMLGVEPPGLEAFRVADEDWDEAPREGAHAYPPGLPYFTRSVRPPALVLPTTLSPVFRPRTRTTYPLVVWHELAHAFLLQREVVRTPAWLGEFVPQAAAALIARRTGLSLDAHLSQIEGEPGFTVRSLRGPAGPEDQMSFQNLLLVLAEAALDAFGEALLPRLFYGLWEQD